MNRCHWNDRFWCRKRLGWDDGRFGVDDVHLRPQAGLVGVQFCQQRFRISAHLGAVLLKPAQQETDMLIFFNQRAFISVPAVGAGN